ncbi:MAG: helix-turn-helix transcriptional regulator [Xanthomonadales bacterium]|nr:helix-turn-helix transcriptional regulator [Xanthomonadales bacterium]
MTPSTESTATIPTHLRSLGARLARLRLARNLTQARLAQESGTSLSSIKRLEAGGNASLETLLRVLAALGLDDRLLDALPDPEVRPVERVKLGGRERQRARARRQPLPASQWAWADDVDDADHGDEGSEAGGTGPAGQSGGSEGGAGR